MHARAWSGPSPAEPGTTCTCQCWARNWALGSSSAPPLRALSRHGDPLRGLWLTGGSGQLLGRALPASQPARRFWESTLLPARQASRQGCQPTAAIACELPGRARRRDKPFARQASSLNLLPLK